MRFTAGLFIGLALLITGVQPGTGEVVQGASCPELRLTTVVPGPPSKRANFTALVSNAPAGVTYSWTISSGKIVRGQDKSMLFVEGSGKITATVTLGGLPASCKKTESATVEIK